jgi:hypothetical protein
MFVTAASDKMKIGKNATIMFMLSIFFGGCASMYAPDIDTIRINTNPEGADVYSGADLLGKTPLAYSFKRATFQKRRLSIRKEGYKRQDLVLGTILEEKSLYNFAFVTTTFGAPCWGIDAINGNMVRYFPDSYLIDLEKKGSPANTSDSTRTLRFRFAVMNQAHLMTDIMAGDGEYLRAYYELRPAHSSIGTYQVFVYAISAQTIALLSTYEPAAFYNELESVLNQI